jgi:hypothetical protein
MRKLTFLMVALQIATAVPAAYSGHETGHGGGVVVCRDSQGKVQSAELLDFWEASALNGLTIIRKNDPVDQQIREAIERLTRWKPSLGKEVHKTYEDLQNIRRDVPEGVAVTPPTDADLDLIKEGCALEGVAKYVKKYPDPAILYMNPRLLAELPKSDQAALWLHEAIYKVFRQKYSAKDSTQARRFASLLFSDQSFPEVPLTEGEFMDCALGSHHIYVSSQGTKIRFWIENDFEYGSTYKEIDSVEVSQLLPYALQPVSEETWKSLQQAPAFDFGTVNDPLGFAFHKGLAFEPSKPGFPWMTLIFGRTGSGHKFSYGCTPYDVGA